jgi:hypothetical protein
MPLINDLKETNHIDSVPDTKGKAGVHYFETNMNLSSQAVDKKWSDVSYAQQFLISFNIHIAYCRINNCKDKPIILQEQNKLTQ